jgi:hypothetical protein
VRDPKPYVEPLGVRRAVSIVPDIVVVAVGGVFILAMLALLVLSAVN